MEVGFFVFDSVNMRGGTKVVDGTGNSFPSTICQVCGEHEAVGVACSAIGALSIAYCQECLQSHREPYWALVASLYAISGMDDAAEWFKPIIEATLEAEGKSVKELFQDVRQAEQEYEAAMQCDSDKACLNSRCQIQEELNAR